VCDDVSMYACEHVHVGIGMCVSVCVFMTGCLCAIESNVCLEICASVYV
jgi:hypothetical protein